jgi:hypothetical protein
MCPGRLSGRVRNRESTANPLGQEIRNLNMPGNRLGMTSLRVLPKRVFLAFPADYATVSPEMPEQSLGFIPRRRALVWRQGVEREGTRLGGAPG